MSSFSFAAFDPSRQAHRFRLSKEEKLKSAAIIGQLFQKGKSVSYHGFTLVFLIAPLPGGYPAQIAFSVPKRHFKHAHDRNRIKRLMREAYRLNKHLLYEKLAGKNQIALMLIYKGKTIPDYPTATQAVLACLNRLILAQ